MRILIDESLPLDFAAELTRYEVSTVRAQRWLGLRNGALLRIAAGEGFDVLITADKALRHQQNLKAIGIAAILVTRVRNRMLNLRPLVPQILTALETIEKGQLVEITPARN